MSSTDGILPMYFSALEIANVKCFGSRQVLDLKDATGAISPWTLILGDNGVGKTTLLKSLVWMTPVEEFNEAIKAGAGISGVAHKPAMDDFENAQFEQLNGKHGSLRLKVGASIAIDTSLGQKFAKAHEIFYSVSVTFKEDGDIMGISTEYAGLPQFETLNLFAYSAGRHMGINNFEQASLKSPTANLFSESGDLYDAEQILSNLEFSSLREGGDGKSTRLLAKVKQVLADLLPDIKSTEHIIVNPPINAEGTLNAHLVEIITPYGKVPLTELSLGYKTMMAWILDLALRMLWRNPEMDDPLSQPAVVLVDEIDLHLHPKWQRMIREYLLRHFPNTQFICTAHSPFMAQSSETENICVLRRSGNESKIENEPAIVRGWRIGQIVTSDLFGIDGERSEEVEEMINRRRALLDKEFRTAEEEVELKELDSQLSALPVADRQEDQQLLDQLRKGTEALKREGRLK
jgi:AAA domain, putative AbiEii toxin, Type IV TA system/AAA domain